jgi:hypothetical protein
VLVVTDLPSRDITDLLKSSIILLNEDSPKKVIETCLEYFIREYPSELPRSYRNKKISGEKIRAELKSSSEDIYFRMSLREDEVLILRDEFKTPSDFIYFDDSTLFSKLMDVLRTQDFRVQLCKLRKLFENPCEMLRILLEVRI